MTIARALAHATTGGIDRVDAQLLLLHALERDTTDRAWLLAHDAEPVPDSAWQEFANLCKRRGAGEPVAYLLGHKEFYGLDLLVDARVLVPRPDTEALVEWALSVTGENGCVIDLGTGSGAVALAIRQHRPAATVEATDTSQAALAVAAENARRLSLAVRFRQADWLEGAPHGRYDLVVSNPPYISAADPHLAGLRHEPLQALDGGGDGLAHLRTIIAQAPIHLRPGGWLLLEHGWDQARAVRGLLQGAGFSAAGSRRDLAGIERCSGGQWLELG